MLNAAALTDEVFYRLEPSGDDGPFSITPGGQLELIRPLDREHTPQYDFTIFATALQYPYAVSYVKVTIDIGDVADSYPTFNQTRYDITVPEDQMLGVTLCTVLAHSEDTFPLQHNIIGGNVGGVFTIDTTSGDLQLVKSLNYDHRQSYEIVVMASSVANSLLTTTAIIEISVENVDEMPVFSEDSYVFNISHNLIPGTVFGYVHAAVYDCPWRGYEGYQLSYTINTVSYDRERERE